MAFQKWYIVTDNGTPFTSAEFSDLTRKNGIRHMRVSPYHPSSDGLAERVVKTFKERMKKASNTGSIESWMARMLFQYRITPHSTTRVSPAESLFGYRIKSHLGQLIPDLATKVESKQVAQIWKERSWQSHWHVHISDCRSSICEKLY